MERGQLYQKSAKEALKRPFQENWIDNGYEYKK